MSQFATIRPDQDPNRPQAMLWDDYARSSKDEFLELLEVGGEPPMQEFLERNPPWVTGPRDSTLGGHHAPPFRAIITQPPLQGMGKRIPDFLHFSSTSSSLQPVLTEIEDPDKHWFTLDGYPTAELTEARNQLDEWRDWLRASSNMSTFLDYFSVPSELRQRDWRPIFRLVYGRRKEFSEGGRHSRSGLASRLNARRSSMTKSDEEYRSWDSMEPHVLHSGFITCNVKDGQYIAKQVAPTFKTTAFIGPTALMISGLEDAISTCEGISNERREYLIERVRYWRIHEIENRDRAREPGLLRTIQSGGE